MNIRPINEADTSEWLLMRNSLWPDSAEENPYEIRQYFEGVSVDIEAVFFIESKNKSIAGFVELNIRSFAEGSRQPRVPYVEAWYVKPEYRHQGFGQALLSASEAWAKAQGFTELASDTTFDNKKSIDLHKKWGFDETERVVCFLKKLT